VLKTAVDDDRPYRTKSEEHKKQVELQEAERRSLTFAKSFFIYFNTCITSCRCAYL